jgi:hypothetical protein
MRSEWLTAISAAVGWGVAIMLAVQNHRWSRHGARAARDASERDRRLAAYEASAQAVARETYDLVTFHRNSSLIDGVEPRDVVGGLAAVAPIRARAYLLPEPWRDRIDWLAVGIGHRFCVAGIAEKQIREDLRDLLSGAVEPRTLPDELQFVEIFPMLAARGRQLREANS